MAHFNFGLVHALLTPFTSSRIDYDAYGKLIDFHLRNGAEGLALPMHAGESVSLTVEERKEMCIRDRLNKEINAVLSDPNMKARLVGLGGEPMSMAPAEFEKFIADETEKWAKVIKFAGIKPR